MILIKKYHLISFHICVNRLCIVDLLQGSYYSTLYLRWFSKNRQVLAHTLV